MNSANKNSFNAKISFIVTGVIFAIVFAVSVFTFNFVWYDFAGTALILMLIMAGIAAFAGVIIICARCAKINKIKNPEGFNPPRDMFYYLRRMGFIILMTVLMSVAISFIGTFINGIVGGFLRNMDDAFKRGFVLKLPMYIVYLYLIYRMFVRYGFMDAQRKIYNINLKMQAFIMALVFMIPNAVYDSMFFTETFDALIVNVQTVLSPNIDIYTGDVFDRAVSEDFNIYLVMLTVIATFAIQLGVAWFAYKRGKKIMFKEHIREINEYEMDEGI